MSRKRLQKGYGSYENKNSKTTKKYPINCDASPKEVFNDPFITDENIISYIRRHGRIMFMIRGHPFTMKTKLSDLLKETYPDSSYCSAVKHIDPFLKDGKLLFKRKPASATHEICRKLVEKACSDNKSVIIVQNSHLRRFEVKPYLDLAVSHDYTVIMAITDDKFDVTFEALEEADKIRKGGLGTEYLKRFTKLEDIPPMFMGWFISPGDSEVIINYTFQIIESLFQCETIRENFGVEINDITTFYKPRKMLSCLAGYTAAEVAMKNYYLSDSVQLSYGKVFGITVVGYLVTPADIIAIVHLNVDMRSLLLYDLNQTIPRYMHPNSGNTSRHGKTMEFFKKENSPSPETLKRDWMEGDEINTAMSSFIHVAQKGINIFNLRKLRNEFTEYLDSIADSNGIIHPNVYSTSDDGNAKFCKLANGALIVKVPQKLRVKTIFTGFYPE